MGLLEEVEKFLREFRSMEKRLEKAKDHILNNVKAFSPDELECMAIGEIIGYTEIPEDLRTAFVKVMVKNIMEIKANDQEKATLKRGDVLPCH